MTRKTPHTPVYQSNRPKVRPKNHLSPPLSARAAAAHILCRLYRDKLPVKKISDTICVQAKLDPRDRHFVMQLVYGVLRHRQELDRMVQLLSKTGLNRLDPLVHQAIVLALYQLFFLDRIPESAAVNEAVNTLKTAGKPRPFQGFCNGILRESLRRRDSLAKEAKSDAQGGCILNHPSWMTARWRDRFGEAGMNRICACNNREPGLVLRTCGAISRDQLLDMFRQAKINATPGMYSDEAIAVAGFSGPVSALPGFGEGFFQVQDEAAQLASLLLTPLKQGGRYLDGCAGLGGKSTHLMALATKCGADIHAVEPDPQRFQLLCDNIGRLFPASTPHLYNCTLEQFAENSTHQFDGILIDAPCSGTGVIRRQPDIRWHRELEDIRHNQRMQLELLELAVRLLGENGTIVYTTCSIEAEENEDVIAAFTGKYPKFTVTGAAAVLPDAARSLCSGSFFAPCPAEAIDGFFGARLIR